MRLTASVWGSLLQLHIQTARAEIPVRYPNGQLALTVTAREASMLAMRRMIAGHVVKDCLKFLILRVPKPAVVRLLATLAPRNSADISIRHTTGIGWDLRLDFYKHYSNRQPVLRLSGYLQKYSMLK